MVQGYEDGFDPVKPERISTEVVVKHRKKVSWWTGDYYDDAQAADGIKAVVLWRKPSE